MSECTTIYYIDVDLKKYDYLNTVKTLRTITLFMQVHVNPHISMYLTYSL